MTRKADDTLIAAALRHLDPGGAGQLTEAERERAETAFARIVATPREEPVPVEPDEPRRRRGRLLVPLVLAGATAVAAPVLMIGGGTAYGTWTPTPIPLTGEAAAAAADTCRTALPGPSAGASASPTAAEGRGRIAVAERRGEWTYVLIEGPGRAQRVCLMPVDDIGKRERPRLFGGYYDTDVADPPAVSPAGIAVNVSAEGQTDEGWFDWLEGFVGSDVVGVTVHTSSGLDIQASVVGNRFAAWWPGRVQSSSHPDGETWSYVVHLADGSSRNATCTTGAMEVC
jgi:hypothetical protein